MPDLLQKTLMKLSVLIPVYNEEMTIGELIERVVRVNVGDIEMEIVVANDGSTDASAHIIEEHRQQHAAMIRAYAMAINLGKSAAIRLGLHYAQGDVILVQDADLELDPNEYGNLLQSRLSMARRTSSMDRVF